VPCSAGEFVGTAETGADVCVACGLGCGVGSFALGCGGDTVGACTPCRSCEGFFQVCFGSVVVCVVVSDGVVFVRAKDFIPLVTAKECSSHTDTVCVKCMTCGPGFYETEPCVSEEESSTFRTRRCVSCAESCGVGEYALGCDGTGSSERGTCVQCQVFPVFFFRRYVLQPLQP